MPDAAPLNLHAQGAQVFRGAVAHHLVDRWGALSYPSVVKRLQLVYAAIMTSAPKVRTNAAENQHYVPKFILRHFLADATKEQVSVFDKQKGKVFPTSIANIMAERRFNDFQVNDSWRVSFEPAAGKVEEHVLATYQRVVANGRLERTAEEQSDLALWGGPHKLDRNWSQLRESPAG